MVHSLHLSQLYFYYTAKLVHLPFLIQIKIIICLSWFNLNTHLEVELQYKIIFDYYKCPIRMYLRQDIELYGINILNE